ncbi:MAG: hypothetical protein K2Z81_22445 [Cyanobacteria bacterium]|nr:hypothetical protein [Cyanobacteriota bacterium]
MSLSMQTTQAYSQPPLMGSTQEVVDMGSLGWQNDGKAAKRGSKVEVEEILMGFSIIGLEAPVVARPHTAITAPVQAKPVINNEVETRDSQKPTGMPLTRREMGKSAAVVEDEHDPQQVLSRMEETISAAPNRVPGENLFDPLELPISFQAESGFQIQDVEDIAVFLARNESLLEKFDHTRIWKNTNIVALDMSVTTPKMVDELIRFLLNSKLEQGLSTIVLEMGCENSQRIVDAFLSERITKEEMSLALGVNSPGGSNITEEIVDIIDFAKKLRIDVLSVESWNSDPEETVRIREEFAHQLHYQCKSRPEERILIIGSSSLIDGANVPKFGFVPSLTSVLYDYFGITSATLTFMGMKQPDNTNLNSLKEVFNYAAIALELEQGCLPARVPSPLLFLRPYTRATAEAHC